MAEREQSAGSRPKAGRIRREREAMILAAAEQ